MVTNHLPMQEMQEIQVPSLGRKWQPTAVFLPENPMDRGAWWATVDGVAKSWTGLSTRAHTHTHTQRQRDTERERRQKYTPKEKGYGCLT